MDTVLKAMKFSAEKHRNQRRKDSEKTPYINHPIDVAAELGQAGVVDPDVIAAALLHDTIEDTDATTEEVSELFGDEILNIVLACSDDKSLAKVERKKEQIRHAEFASNKAKLVKLSDKYSNMKTMFDNPPSQWSKEVVLGYVYWTYAVVRPFPDLNSYFKEKLNEEFMKFGFNADSISEEELTRQLEIYYGLIKGKE